MGWFSGLLSVLPFLRGVTAQIAQITSKITDLKIAQVQAGTEQEKIRIGEEIAVTQAQRDVLMRQNDRDAHITTMARMGLTFPVAFILWKLFVWDKGIGSLMGCSGDTTGIAACVKYTTDKLDPNMWWVISIVCCFFFVQNISTIWKRVG